MNKRQSWCPKYSPQKDDEPYFDDRFIKKQPVLASELPGDNFILGHVQVAFTCFEVMFVINFHCSPPPVPLLDRYAKKITKESILYFQINPFYSKRSRLPEGEEGFFIFRLSNRIACKSQIPAFHLNPVKADPDCI